ncbi:MAG: hypothetical protein JJU20_03625 [Opitutales bacterium]|nr:hypothetical protein [Opitutales bacterium]
MNQRIQSSGIHSGRRVRLVVLLFGWMLATGTILDVVQVFAWSRMWVDNVQTQSVGEAFARTFSEEGMCPLCHSVQAVKRDQAERFPYAVNLLERNPVLPVEGFSIALVLPDVFERWPKVLDEEGLVMAMRPPAPPPRIQVS